MAVRRIPLPQELNPGELPIGGPDQGNGAMPGDQFAGPLGNPNPVFRPQKPGQRNDDRSAEAPRDRPQPGPTPPIGTIPGGQATPTRPSSPTSMAGSASPATGGVTPFSPMEGIDPAALAALGGSTGPDGSGGAYGNPFSSRRRPVFGAQGGLQGGGLGVPQSGTTGAESDPISSLIQQLLAQR